MAMPFVSMAQDPQSTSIANIVVQLCFFATPWHGFPTQIEGMSWGWLRLIQVITPINIWVSSQLEASSLIAKDWVNITTKVAIDSLHNLPISKSWVISIVTYQTNRKVMSGHVHNMPYIKLTMTLGLGTLFIIFILSSILEHWARLMVGLFL